MMSRRRAPEVKRAAGAVLLFTAMAVLAAAGGCQSHPVAATQPLASTQPADPLAGLTPAVAVDSVRAHCDPPLGWAPEPLKSDDRHTDQVWLSPSHKTAYGVIHFTMPVPWAPDDVLMQNFLDDMKKQEGSAQLITQTTNATLGVVQFLAVGGEYTVRTNMFKGFFEGWFVYAATDTSETVVPDELEIAERARDHTKVGP